MDIFKKMEEQKMIYNNMENLTDVNVNKFRRGQIWWVNKDEAEEEKKMKDPNVFTVAKSRPWLIVSNDAFNANSGKITCVPLVSVHNKSDRPSYVGITLNGKRRFITCSEIQTYSCFEINGNYIGTVDMTTMNKVDDALNDYLGINTSPSLRYIESLIEKKISMYEQNKTDIKDLARKLNTLISINTTVSSATKVTHPSSTLVLYPEKKETKIEEKVNINKGSRWTIEKITSFVNDYLKLGVKDTAEKYGLTVKTTQQYYSKYYRKVKCNTWTERELATRS